MRMMGGTADERGQSSRLQAQRLVEEDISDGLLTSSSHDEFEDLVDEKELYVRETTSLLEAQGLKEQELSTAEAKAAA